MSDTQNDENDDYEHDPADGPPRRSSDTTQQADPDPTVTLDEARERRRERDAQKAEQARQQADPFAPDDADEAAEIRQKMAETIETHPALADYTASELEEMYPWYEASEEQQAREFAEHALGQASDSEPDVDRDTGRNATDETDHGRSHDGPSALASTPSMGDDTDGGRDTRSAAPNAAPNATDSMSDNDRPATSSDQPRERAPEQRERRERRADGSADRDEATPISDDSPRERRQEPINDRREQQSERREEPGDDIPPSNRDNESPARDADVPGENLSPNDALARTINDRNRTKEDTLRTPHGPVPVAFRKGEQDESWDFARAHDQWMNRQLPAGSTTDADTDDGGGGDSNSSATGDTEQSLREELQDAVSSYRDNETGQIDYEAMDDETYEDIQSLSEALADESPTTYPDGEFINACVNFLCAGRRNGHGEPIPVIVGQDGADGPVDTTLVTGAIRSGQVPVREVTGAAISAMYFSLEHDLDQSFL